MALNATLLRRTLDVVRDEYDPRSGAPYEVTASGRWNQGTFRCGTAMCFAGWTVQLSGGDWVGPADRYDSPMVVASSADDPNAVVLLAPHVPAVSAAARAERLLGITERDADELFSAGNTLADLEDMVEFLLHHGSLEEWLR